MTAQPVPLKISVLGELELEIAGRPWAGPASRGAQALLGYLALRPGPFRRTEAASELWPEVLDSSARGSLRSAIWTLRRALGDHAENRLIATRVEVDGLLHCLRAAAQQLVCVNVEPLPPPHVAEIVRENTRLDPHGVHRAVALADGNPFLALDAARALERGEDPAAGLGAMVRDAIGRLSTEARDIAELAAVAGGRLTGQQLLELGATQAAERALESGVLTIDRDGIRFRHALLCDAVRGQILPTRRAVLHERAATVAAEPAARAHHLSHAGRRKLAAAALKESAERALAVGALDEAAGLLGDAIELDGREPHLRLRLARAEAWRGNGDAAGTQLRFALELHDCNA